MSAVAVLVETPCYVEASVAIASPEERLRDLVHDLRQPLSSIEAIAYYLEMTLPAEQLQARQYMRACNNWWTKPTRFWSHACGRTQGLRASGQRAIVEPFSVSKR